MTKGVPTIAPSRKLYIKPLWFAPAFKKSRPQFIKPMINSKTTALKTKSKALRGAMIFTSLSTIPLPLMRQGDRYRDITNKVLIHAQTVSHKGQRDLQSVRRDAVGGAFHDVGKDFGPACALQRFRRQR